MANGKPVRFNPEVTSEGPPRMLRAPEGGWVSFAAYERDVASAREEGRAAYAAECFKEYEKYGGWTSLTSRAEAWLAVCDAMDAAVPDWAISGTGTGVEKMVDAIKALAAARIAPPGHVIDDHGVVRKVLGTLPVTADGGIALMPGSVTHPHSKVLGIPVFSDDANKWLGEFDHTGAGAWFYAPLSECLPYSAAAEAARKAPQ